MRKSPKPSGLKRALVISALLHLVGFSLPWALGLIAVEQRPPPQPVLLTKLVRLGPERSEALLPQMAKSQVAPPPKPTPARTVEKKVVQKAAPKSATQPDSSVQTQSALSRLKKQLAGRVDGDAQGDTDEAQLGDAYVAGIKKQIWAHYVIEGIDRAQVAGRTTVVLIKIQADGRIMAHQLEQSSGLAVLDQAVERAIISCGQVEPPPDGWRRRLRQEGILIDFTN